MAAEQPNNIKKPLCAGLLAHVDAGKTTLSEAMLYEAGARRTLGRVDHQDAFLDTHALERARGITIFSKQALLETEHRAVTLVDTPGHVDFSAEAERIMPVLDCAVLVISGTDGVQAHTLTLWRLLERYQVPTFLFLNKMDLPGMGKDRLLAELRQQLSPACVDFTASPEEIAENAAMCDEALLENYLETGGVTVGNLRALIAGRKLFPCCFGSGLKLDGVGMLLDILDKYAPETAYPGEFAAKVYKISRDPQGNRLTWLKVTGGSLKIRSALRYVNQTGSVGSADPAAIREIKIKWISGSVTVESGDVQEITFLESGNGTDKYEMVWKQSGDELVIQYSKDSNIAGFGLHFGDGNKDLTVTVPRGWVCDSLELDTASTDLAVRDMIIREMEIDSASGTAKFENCTVSSLDVDTASGDVTFTGSLSELDFEAASASFTGVLENVPDKVKMDSMSGGLTLTLPEDAGFTVSLDAMSSDFSSDFPTVKKNKSYVCGDGHCKIDVDAMSGDVSILKQSADAVVKK